MSHTVEKIDFSEFLPEKRITDPNDIDKLINALVEFQQKARLFGIKDISVTECYDSLWFYRPETQEERLKRKQNEQARFDDERPYRYETYLKLKKEFEP